MKKFKIVNNESAMDSIVTQRTFTGRLTRFRYKILDRFVRMNNNKTYRCHHDFDCCGCVCGRDAELIIGQHTTTVKIITQLNY